MNHFSSRSLWTAGSVILVVISLVGTGFFVYSANRYNQEMTATESLRMDLATLRATQTRLQKSVDHLDLLPPIAEPNWEKSLTDQINDAAIQAGVTVDNLTYSSDVDQNDGALGIVAFNLDITGNDTSQARCLKLLEETVVGMRFEAIDGTLGGGDPYYLSLMAGESGYADSMRISGKVYREVGGD